MTFRAFGRGRWNRRPARVLVAVALAAACPLPLAAQDAAPTSGEQEPPIFSEQIRVEVVELEVVVEDRKGVPIEGLQMEDFRVRVDGKPTEITNFYAVGAAGSRSDPAAQEVAGLVDQRLRMAIVADLPTLPFGRARRVLEDLAEATAEALDDGDEVLVATLDRELEVVQPFTEDHAAVAAAMRDAGRSSVRMGEADREMRQILQELLRISPPGGAFPSAGGGDEFGNDNDVFMVQSMARNLRAMIDQYAQRRARDASQTVQLLAAAVDRLSGLSGRKVVLYVGGGYEDQPGQALSEAWVDKFSDPVFQVPVSARDELPRTVNLSTSFARLGEYANANGVTFYALAPDTGMRTFGITAEIQGPDPTSGADLAGTAGTMHDMTRSAPLTAMAVQTGGATHLGDSNLRQFVEDIRSDGDAQYSLGFRLAGSGDGDEQHRVEVKVSRPGARVRHQATVRPRTAVEKAEAATLAALVHGEGENGFDLSVEFGVAEASEKGQVILPVTVRFPLVRLAYLPRGDEHVGRATLLIATMDADQDLSSVQTVELPIRIPTSELVNALQELGQYEAKLRIRTGPHRIAVGLHDEIADGTSTLVAEHLVQLPDAG